MLFFFFSDTATTEIYTLSLHDALPIFKNIGTIKVYMKDRSQRDAVNRPWLEMFPDEDDRPARHAIEYDAFPPGVLVQLEIIAVVD